MPGRLKFMLRTSFEFGSHRIGIEAIMFYEVSGDPEVQQ
jgi:hypothetical protein